ncbi:methyltransferase domain-containing protein [Kitasatospora kazusensis]|uniref:Protein-L-isoaspartate O-methyltransferase n=1 Tax=Kitasatospora kazusensis TaxID=407974 RepID=A0ABP5KUM4_9ACTN
MQFEPYAARLAAACVHPASRWAQAVAAVPRHIFVPRWWERGAQSWELVDGTLDKKRWMETAYTDRTLVTRIGPLHADHANAGDLPAGHPTSSGTLPGLVVTMLRHAMIPDSADVLCVVGSGYTPAVLSHRLGYHHVTGMDVDKYLTDAADDRLSQLGMRPRLITGDITVRLPVGAYDRIVSTVAVPGVPASWLDALRPGGRLVTTLADTGLIVTADKQPDGSAVGRVEWDRAGFMAARTGDDYAPDLMDTTAVGWIADQDGETVTESPFPVINIPEAWELWSMLSITTPGLEHRYREDPDGRRTAWMLHPDGSWARASSANHRGPATVHQGGPRQLWDQLDRVRRRWLGEGSLPVYGAHVTVTPDGVTTLTRGGWSTVISSPWAAKPTS